MRLFHRSAPPEEESSAEVEPAAPRLPADPIELGLLLRSTRERLGIGLEEVRDEIDVPLVDLDALERGQLETLLTQQAAVIALWRYAERLGLDASGLVGVLRTHWPNRVLAVNAIVSRRGFTPIAELRTASHLLSPISDPVSLGTMSLGLSQTTKEILEARSAKHLFALQLLAPAIALQRSQLGSGSMAALRAAAPVEAAAAPQLPSAEDDDEGRSGTSTLDDRAVLEHFMASSAAPVELGEDDLDAVVTEREGLVAKDAGETDLVEPSLVPEEVATGEVEVASEDEAALAEDAVTLEERAEFVETGSSDDERIDAGVAGPAVGGPLTIAQPVISFPAPSAAAQAAVASSGGPAPLIPNFGELIGRAQSKNRWVRYVSKYVAERLGVTPEGVDPTPPPEHP